MLPDQTSFPHKTEDESKQKFKPQDDKSFSVKTIKEEKLIDTLPEGDDEQQFRNDMYNYGEMEDLPDSDREMACRSEGISRDDCFDH